MKQPLLFAGKKLLRAALLLLGVSLAAFLLLCASPLDPLQTNVGQVALGSMSQEQVANLKAYWGVDQPPVERYLGWLSSVLQGDFGTSLLYRQPVLSVIGQRLGNSLWLLVSAWAISGVLGWDGFPSACPCQSAWRKALSPWRTGCGTLSFPA